MKNKVLKFALLISLLLNFSVLFSASYTHIRQSRMGDAFLAHELQEHGGAHYFERLNLRPEQLDAIRGKVLPFHGAVKERRQALNRKRADLLSLMREEDADHAAIERTISGISQAQEEVQRMVVVHMLELKAEMDSHQQKDFLDLIEDAMSEQRATQCP
jgi:Spy/CpxP family protein refolding chaperone